MKNVLITGFMSLTLVACGDINIQGEANIGGGLKEGSNSPTELMAGPCGLYEIVNYYEHATFNGKCELTIASGTVIDQKNIVTQNYSKETLSQDLVLRIPTEESTYYDNSFFIYQFIQFLDGGAPEWCDVQLVNKTLILDCDSFYLETQISE